MSSKALFKSKIGLIAATVGSAIGLGNVWRFPAETQAGGGAAFLLLYVGCVLVLGIPVMLAEMALGRQGRSDSVGVFKALSPRTAWWVVGATAILASYVILSFYMVVAGWTIEYMWQSVTGALYAPAAPGQSIGSEYADRMSELIFEGWRPLVGTFVMIALNIFVLVKGVSKGIERMSNVMMPLLFVILVVFCTYSLTLPGAGEGLRFFLMPDFSKITPSVVVGALGQTFFSLSLGMGILVTYASYYPASTRLPRTAVIVAALSLLVAVLMGLVIFPAVKTFGLDKESIEGATLVFVTLPEVFSNLPCPAAWSTVFFVLLWVAAFTSTVSIAEVSIAFVADRFGMSRVKACLTVLLPLFVLSAVCALSFGVLGDVTIFGRRIFDALDNFATNWLLPLVSMGICLYVGWFGPRGLLSDQLSNGGTVRSRFTAVVTFIIRYIAPPAILIILLSPML